MTVPLVLPYGRSNLPHVQTTDGASHIIIDFCALSFTADVHAVGFVGSVQKRHYQPSRTARIRRSQRMHFHRRGAC